MHLDIVIPTYNRCASLDRTLLSIFGMPVPHGHSLTIIVADNNSTDGTRQSIERRMQDFQGRLQYVSAARGQGRSFALNAGISASMSELVGFIDDDEEVEPNWARTVFDAFADPGVDYVGGRYAPVWEAPPPSWVDHPNTRTGIGWADFGPIPRVFEEEGFDGLAIGGNCIIRRKCFDSVGLYSEALGRSGARLLGAEDTDMQERLQAGGFHGVYLPNLIVRHHIPASRLTKAYMRRWAFWTAASYAQMMRLRPTAEPRWFGVPRYMYGRLLGSPGKWLRAAVENRPAEVFHHELTFWRFIGFFYAVNIFTRSGVT